MCHTTSCTTRFSFGSYLKTLPKQRKFRNLWIRCGQMRRGCLGASVIWSKAAAQWGPIQRKECQSSRLARHRWPWKWFELQLVFKGQRSGMRMLQNKRSDIFIMLLLLCWAHMRPWPVCTVTPAFIRYSSVLRGVVAALTALCFPEARTLSGRWFFIKGLQE